MRISAFICHFHCHNLTAVAPLPGSQAGWGALFESTAWGSQWCWKLRKNKDWRSTSDGAKMGQDGPSLEMVLEVVLLSALHRCASEFEVFSQVAVVTILHGVLDLLTWHTQHAAPCHLALLGRLSARLLAISIESNVLPCLLRTGEWCAKPQGAQDPPSAHVASRCQAEMENYFRDWSEELWSRTSTWA